VPTFVRFLDVIQGEQHSGASAPGWPFSSQRLASHASALLYDIDRDGQLEIMISTIEAQIVFFRQNGTIVEDATLQVMPLPVRKFWFHGLKEVKHVPNLRKNSINDDDDDDDDDNFEEQFLKQQHHHQRKTMAVEEAAGSSSGLPWFFGPGHMPSQDSASTTDSVSRHGFKPGAGWLSPEARQSMDDFFTPSSLKPFLEEGEHDASSKMGKKHTDPFQSPTYKTELDELKKRYTNVGNAADPYLLVDPHILSTPIIVDLDQDGHDELIISTSYYFDREYYSNPDNRKKLDIDVDISKYVAGAITVIDLHTGETKWTAFLDLSTDKTKLRAYIYDSPTVIDLDSDGNLEVIVGTSLGFIYVLDKYGKPKPGFPISMGEIQGQIFADDINMDGEIELCAADFSSNLACFDKSGKELWAVGLMGSAAQVPVMGDINGDGIMELVVGTNKGFVHAVRTDTGNEIPHFPLKTDGPIYASALLIDLSPQAPKLRRGLESLDVVVPSFDGFVYIINGKSGCTHKIDIGEKSFSQVLADDFTNTGKMQLIVSTMNGNIFVLDTQAFYHPLKAQLEEYHSTNGFTFRYRHHGIHVTKGSRRTRDVIGNEFKLAFKITDMRRLPKGTLRHYHVRISVGRDEILQSLDYSLPGTYLVVVPAPKSRMHATVTVEMINEHGQVFRDHFAISFNMGFLRIIKWALVGPFAALAAALFFLKGDYKKKIPLPVGAHSNTATE